METTTESKPMLSDDEMTNAFFGSKYAGDHSIHQLDGAKAVRDFYEAKITSGELMVVKTCTMSVGYTHNDDGSGDPYWFHSGCANAWSSEVLCRTPTPMFCPGCGARIAE